MKKKDLLALLKHVGDDEEIEMYVDDYGYGDPINIGYADCVGVYSNSLCKNVLDLRVNYMDEDEE